MRFINVTDEQYALIRKISEETNSTTPEVIQDLIEGFQHFAVLSFMQDSALKLAKTIICDEENQDGKKESEGDI